MIGVILWSNPAKEKAVIWCEDHGALAYLQGQENLDFPCEWPEAGDLVELEYETVNDLRGALPATLRALEPFIQPLIVKARLEDGNGKRR